jgi:L-threonylcarbamoyladenylate synthase
MGLQVNSNSLKEAAQVIQQGGIVAYATEYCFGLGCDPRNRAAVGRLCRIKRRSPGRGLILIAADTEQLTPYVSELPQSVRQSWPGPHTWLLPPASQAPNWIQGRHPRIAVRVTAHKQAAALCRRAGMAIVSTSANHAGETPARRYRDVLRRLSKDVDFVLPGRVGTLTSPTPIRDAVSGDLVRAG